MRPHVDVAPALAVAEPAALKRREVRAEVETADVDEHPLVSFFVIIADELGGVWGKVGGIVGEEVPVVGLEEGGE